MESSEPLFIQDDMELHVSIETAHNVQCSDKSIDPGHSDQIYFRCTKVKLRGPQCGAAIYHLFKNDSDVVLEYRTRSDHTHAAAEESFQNKLKLETEVEKLVKLNVKPKRIMQDLSEMEGIALPTFDQLKTLIAKIRKRIFGQVTISMNELSALLGEHKAVPDDVHESFVLCEEVNIDSDEPYFRFLITTKHLLGTTTFRNFTHSDTTYKCVWQGFPVFMIGTTDWDKTYHPYGLCVCSNEQTDDFKFLFQGIKDGAKNILNHKMEQKAVVCDAAGAIINAFIEVFGDDVTVVMCWFHAKVAMEEHLKMVKEENRQVIMADIGFLHIASTPDMFDNGAGLFMCKWMPKEPGYCKFFEDQWLIKHRNWYLGAAEHTPCHNNALESSNRYLKDSNTIRIRHPLPHFIKVALQTVRTWSKDYTIGLRKFATRPSVGLPLLTNGYNWAKTNVPCKIVQDDDVSTTVEVCSQVAQCQKRVAKDAFVVSESSSAIITSSHAQNHRTDVETNAIFESLANGSLSQSAADVTEPLSTKRGRKRKAVTVSSSESANRIDIVVESQSQSLAADVIEPLSTKRGRKRKAVTMPSSGPKKQVAATASPSESANRIDIVVESQSQSLAADVIEPLSTKRGRKRKAVTMPSSGPKTATVSLSESANRIDKVIESPSQSSAGAADVTERKAAAVSESFSQSSAKDTNLADVENFEMYKRTFSKWTVKISKKDATYESRCNCPAYLKEYLCKHIIGLGIRFKLISVPPEAKNVPIGQKRKRGRPSKTKPALMLQ